eukprot:CAMPEP_0119532852 /NCGR_PEP_ID=MMETSP1344-20130328/46301_1 /TAXON_ID=236787 /ORGANISM="Florenciella parvula, Strain CCMP2471" /LENGTH=44 /DNA_ID= /DNA_START= /DNA_END= /DNA_ORIENTATION=
MARGRCGADRAAGSAAARPVRSALPCPRGVLLRHPAHHHAALRR